MKFKIDVAYTVWRTIEVDVDVDQDDLKQHRADLSQIQGLGPWDVDSPLSGIDLELWQTANEPDEWKVSTIPSTKQKRM